MVERQRYNVSATRARYSMTFPCILQIPIAWNQERFLWMLFIGGEHCYYWILGEPAEEECSNARYAVLDLLH
ncbi:hypothetical protein HZ326_7214 [Fusarium oxysporum f. sp. albedinis]|nr:hypothetical protein HZ326_7214 [Fusarium oxysporum f. sp. albedinis]